MDEGGDLTGAVSATEDVGLTGTGECIRVTSVTGSRGELKHIGTRCTRWCGGAVAIGATIGHGDVRTTRCHHVEYTQRSTAIGGRETRQELVGIAHPIAIRVGTAGRLWATRAAEVLALPRHECVRDHCASGNRQRHPARCVALAVNRVDKANRVQISSVGEVRRVAIESAKSPSTWPSRSWNYC
jgi:hypothetical protein